MKLIRVFPRKTKASPDDNLAYFGPPTMFAEADEVQLCNGSVSGFRLPEPSGYKAWRKTKAALERHLWGIPRSKRGQRWIVPLLDLRAAVDDSGSHEPSPYYAIAGFISMKESWDDFADRWLEEVLEGTPPLSYFKRHEAFVGEKQFAGWAAPQISERITKCVELINSHVMVRVSRALLRKDYESHFRGTLPKEVDDPYFILFFSLIYGVMLYQKQYGWNTQVDFVFDEQGAIGKRSRDWYPVFCEMAALMKDYLPPEPLFLDDKYFFPLQAADLYAWNVHRQLVDNKAIYMPPSYELPMLDNMQKIDKVLDLHDLARIRADVEASLKRSQRI